MAVVAVVVVSWSCFVVVFADAVELGNMMMTVVIKMEMAMICNDDRTIGTVMTHITTH